MCSSSSRVRTVVTEVTYARYTFEEDWNLEGML
jgi:hypothetical protein